MNDGRGARRRGLAWRVISVPIFFKILGIGMVVAFFFGSITVGILRAKMVAVLYRALLDQAQNQAHVLAESLEQAMATGDVLSVKLAIDRLRSTATDVRYVIVWDDKGRIAAHSFPDSVPSDLRALAPPAGTAQTRTRVLGSPEGLIVDAVVPILRGIGGNVQLGIRDLGVVRELRSLTRSILWSLGFSALIGLGLAFVLTHILTRPIHDLERSVQQIRAGNLAARARVWWGDEIGDLARAFNRMAEDLQRTHRQVVEKEKARLALLEKIVHAQEEERRMISRELHDHFGQSLLAIMLAIRSTPGCREAAGSACRKIEEKLGQVVEDLDRLARGMRPPILDDYGLEHALARYVEETARHVDFQIDYQCSGGGGAPRLPNHVEISLYRIVQEALSNIIRHANASQASIILLRQSGSLLLIIEDDGCGFDRSKLSPEQGLGLTSMSERVALLGGRFDIASAPGEGTTVRTRIPLEVDSCRSAS